MRKMFAGRRRLPATRKKKKGGLPRVDPRGRGGGEDVKKKGESAGLWLGGEKKKLAVKREEISLPHGQGEEGGKQVFFDLGW